MVQIPTGSVTNAQLAGDIRVGSLATLITNVQSSVTGAINELQIKITAITNDVGNKANLLTTNKATIVAGINELKQNELITNTNIGTLETAIATMAFETETKVSADAFKAEKGKVHTAINVTGSNVYNVNTGGNFIPSEGRWLKIMPNVSNGGGAKLNIDGSGELSVRHNGGASLAAGDF